MRVPPPGGAAHPAGMTSTSTPAAASSSPARAAAPSRPLPILVAGAGPGGLVAALALQRVGWPVRVLERAPVLRAAGAGLTLQANATRMLAALGLADAVRAVGEPLRVGRIENARGDTLGALAMGEAAGRWGQPGVAVHRAALSGVLEAALPPGTLRCGAGVASVEPGADEVTVRLDDGSAIRGAALVGADGIASTVREAVVPGQPIRYAGYTCWRGVAPVPRPLGDGVMVERWGPGRRFGVVPLDAERTYWFATENAAPGGADGADPRAELLARFADFAEPVRALLSATPPDAVLRNDVVDLAPLPRWTAGRVTLLGDAAHAMTPNMGQGACQAIEDAVVLGSQLASAAGAEVPAALAAYEARRRPRAAALVQRSWRLGRVAQWEGRLARGLRDALTRATPSSAMARQMDALWGVEVPALPPAP